MTPEERFAKIEEKHQALVMHIEVLVGMQQETERKLQSLIETTNRFEVRTQQILDRFDKGMDQSARILQNHEHRLDALEG